MIVVTHSTIGPRLICPAACAGAGADEARPAFVTLQKNFWKAGGGVPRWVLERDCTASGRCEGFLSTVEKLGWHENATALLSALWVLQRAQVAHLLNDDFLDQPAFN